MAHIRDTDGPPQPYRLGAHASETWVVDALPAAREVDQEGGERDAPLVGPAQFRFVAAAGNGKTARDGVTYTAVRLIADARWGTSPPSRRHCAIGMSVRYARGGALGWQAAVSGVQLSPDRCGLVRGTAVGRAFLGNAHRVPPR